MHVDTDVLTIIANMSGWVLVGYLVKDYFGRLGILEKNDKQRMEEMSRILVNQQLHNQRTEFLEKQISKIEQSVEDIKELIQKEREELIKELKQELRRNEKD